MTLTPEQVREKSERAEKVKYGYEQLRSPILGPSLRLVCDEHGYQKPAYLLARGKKFAVCRLCVAEYIDVGEIEFEAGKSKVPIVDGGPGEEWG